MVGHSCADNISGLCQLIGKSQETKPKLHMAFTDLEQAYGNVPRERLWVVQGPLKETIK